MPELPPGSPTTRLDDVERTALFSICEQVIGAIYEVTNTLGPGFLEKVYEQALLRELKLRDVCAEAQVPVPVFYKGAPVGTYFADLIVEGKLIVELKCIDRFADEHMAQCLNYLTATGLRMCLLVSFQHAKVRWERVVLNF